MARGCEGRQTGSGDWVALVDIIMPQMGESIAEGTLSKWLKKVGDEVKRDEPI
ncbi:MAG: biotin/lipoyl-containing protein, partial [Gemmatimonadales bacterium]